ncbi:MAG: hypothetical protein JXB46_11230 [Candidatus Eisenbacteria bacterium]|nr:hypothetical protein [Candidatus Eisenbacteria bacterium]
MRIGWEQEFDAIAKHGGVEEGAHFKIVIELEGPQRDMMTDVDPIWEEIEALEGARLWEHGMRSTAEGVALHVGDVVRRHLEGTADTLKSIRVVQDEVFWVDV